MGTRNSHDRARTRTVVVMAALITLAGTALAEERYRVLESSVTDLKVGASLSPDAQLKVPKGSEIRVLDLAQTTTHRIIGPFEGTMASYQPCGGLRRMFGFCPTVEDEPVGGTRGPRKRVIGPSESGTKP